MLEVYPVIILGRSSLPYLKCVFSLTFSDPLLKCTIIESTLSGTVEPSDAIPNILQSIRTSVSHKEVSAGLNRLYLLAVAFWRCPNRCMHEPRPWWRDSELHRFIRVLPACTEDYRLLIHCLQALTNLEFSPPFIGHHSLEVSANQMPGH